MSMINCPVCNKNTPKSIVILQKQPLSNLALASTYEKATSSFNFDIEICMCASCSHIYNKNASLENITYKQEENATYYIGEVWRKYTEELANQFMQKYNINNLDILEIGCGDITFLKKLHKNKNRCTGYEPSFPEKEKEIHNVQIINDYFYPDKDFNKKYDIIILRHVLEHLEDVKTFLSDLIRGMIKNSPNAKLFIEVPNIQPTLNEFRTNDFVYEHISYFSFYSLKYLLTSLNLEIFEMYSTFNNENIIAICHINTQYIDNLQLIENASKGFQSNINSLRNEYKRILKENKTICIWGAGGRGSSFLNIIKNELTHKEILVDSDQRKFEKYVPVVGLKISDYKLLQNKSIDAIIITTSLGRENILLEIKKYNIKVNQIYTISRDGLKQYQ